MESAALRRAEHVPTADDYPDSVVRRISFMAGGGHGWRISALVTPRERPTAWKIVVITGAPSWAEYWAPIMAALPQDREMVVVDRPGFACSEPACHVPDISVQAQALSPLLAAAPGQQIVLVGQSYGAAIATLMAADQPRRVASLVLLSGFFGQAGPTARWLLDLGARALALIPRDLRNAVLEVAGQAPQLDRVRAALAGLDVPIHLVHGDKDDFAPIEIAEQWVAEIDVRRPARVVRVAGGDHFINDGPVDSVLAALEACIPQPAPSRLRWPALPKLRWPWLRSPEPRGVARA
jgi:pimeloyl-ACP methyl ester carboxylesterase